MTHSVISVHIGQCGVQLGYSVWELLCAEHGVGPQGLILEDEGSDLDLVTPMETFFFTSAAGRHVPRAIFVDLDPMPIDEIRVGPSRGLFHPDQLVSGLEDASSNFSRGYYTVGRNIIEKFMQTLRQQVESTDSIQGFIISHAPNGGTGGGVASLLHECISLCYPKTIKMNVSILPSPHIASATVDPYNTTLSTHFTMEQSDLSFMLDNEALYNVCHRNLMLRNCTFHNVNRILSHLWSSITAAFRYPGILNSGLMGILTNLVPFPRLQFPVCSFAPIANTDRADHQQVSCATLSRDVFKPENRFIHFDPQAGKYMTCILMFRGDICSSDAIEAVNHVKKADLEFVDWCPTGIKVTMNRMPPAIVPQSLMTQSKLNVTMLANTSAIGDVWQAIATKTKLLYTKRAFVHWFVSEGMEEGEINDSIENIASLIQDYRECGYPTEISEAGATNQDEEPPAISSGIKEVPEGTPGAD